MKGQIRNSLKRLGRCKRHLLGEKKWKSEREGKRRSG